MRPTLVKLLFICLILNIANKSEAQVVSQKDAIKLAKECIKDKKRMSAEESPAVKDVKPKKLKDEPSFYAVNFTNGGYVLIAAEEGVHSIIGFSESSTFDENQLSEAEKLWLDCVCNNIEYKRMVKKASHLKSAKTKPYIESELENIQSNFLLTTTSVPSLFETYQTSRWAYWYPYSIEFPNQDATNSCVPLAMAQIMNYYHFPPQGSGTHSGVDFSQEWFDYNQMPFRLTYCGNGESNCDEGSFDILPGTTVQNETEVSTLIYKCAISVD